jgi:hypothetical protein
MGLGGGQAETEVGDRDFFFLLSRRDSGVLWSLDQPPDLTHGHSIFSSSCFLGPIFSAHIHREARV